MAAVLSRNLNNVDTLTIYMSECRRMGIRVLGPDINESMRQFSANVTGDVRFGLAAIKGVGEAAVDSIIAERKRGGMYKDIYDFVERVNYSVVNRKCMESIAYAGGFDSIAGFDRSKFFYTEGNNGASFLDQLVRYGQRIQSERNNAQQSLFGGDSGIVDIAKPAVPTCENWTQLEKLNRERDVIGLYLSAHPLDDYKVIIEHMCKNSVGDLDHLDELKGQEVSVAGMVVAVQNLVSKSGKPWGKFKVEGYNGSHEFALFGKDYENFRKYLFENYFLNIRGKVQPRPYNEAELEFRITQMMQLSELQEMIKEIHVQVPIADITHSLIEEMNQVVRKSKGKTRLWVKVYDPHEKVSLTCYSKTLKVNLTQELADFFDRNEIAYVLM
jgi:DNA polymerase-3 subunit alpha